MARHLPPDEPIDLLNVAFENPRKIQAREDSANNLNGKGRGKRQDEDGMAEEMSRGKSEAYAVPDRVSGLEELEVLRKLSPMRRWNFVRLNMIFLFFCSLMSLGRSRRSI